MWLTSEIQRHTVQVHYQCSSHSAMAQRHQVIAEQKSEYRAQRLVEHLVKSLVNTVENTLLNYNSHNWRQRRTRPSSPNRHSARLGHWLSPFVAITLHWTSTCFLSPGPNRTANAMADSSPPKSFSFILAMHLLTHILVRQWSPMSHTFWYVTSFSYE